MTSPQTAPQAVPAPTTATPPAASTPAGLTVNIADGAEVGIAAPIVLGFDAGFAQPAAVLRQLRVDVDVPGVQGAWVWLPNSTQARSGNGPQLVFRPTTSPAGAVPYWPAGATVTLSADLTGIDLGNGHRGGQLRTTFRIRPGGVTVVADATTGRLVVLQAGRVTRNYPAAYAPDADGRALTSGIHAVTEKTAKFSINTVTGSDEQEATWVIRVSDAGEFIDSPANGATALGRPAWPFAGIDLAADDAEDLFGLIEYGDPVVVQNTGRAMDRTEPDAEWASTPSEWRARAAGNPR